MDKSVIPAGMRALPNWVVHTKDKRPYNPKTNAKRMASASDPATWSDFETAFRVLLANPDMTGLGFMLGNSPYVGIDIDKVVYPDGSIYPEAEKIVEQIASYTEKSPSATGLHIIAQGNWHGIQSKYKQYDWPVHPNAGGKVSEVEVYETDRYFTVTGDIVSGRVEINSRQPELDKLAADLDSKLARAKISLISGDGATGTSVFDNTGDLLLAMFSQPVDPDQVPGIRRPYVLRAMHNKGHKDGYDKSSTDWSYFWALAYWTNGDIEQMKEVAEQSALIRDKWYEKRRDKTWLEWQLEKAAAEIPATYKDQPAAQLEVWMNKVAQNAPYTDLGSAEAFMEIHKNRIAHNEALGWLFETDYVWSGAGAKEMVGILIGEFLKRRLAVATAQGLGPNLLNQVSPQAYRIRAVMGIVERLAYTPVETFEADPYSLSVANGVLDLRSGKLRAHVPEDRFTYRLDVRYNPESDNTEFEDLMWQNFTPEDPLSVAPGYVVPEVIECLQRALGYGLTGETTEDKAFFIYGQPRSGKGLIFDTIAHMLKDSGLFSEVPHSVFTKDRKNDSNQFDLAPLQHCRIITSSESINDIRIGAETIKLMTGGNLIQASFKYKDVFSFRPQFKIFMTSNHPINLDNDFAAWNRFVIFRMPNSYLNREDKSLRSRLREPEVQEGLLTWLVAGAIKWYKFGDLAVPDHLLLQRDQQMEEQDHLGAFIRDCCEIDSGAWARADEMFTTYKDHFLVTRNQNSGHYAMNRFSRELQSKGFVSTRKMVAGIRKTGFVGIQLKDGVQEQYANEAVNIQLRLRI